MYLKSIEVHGFKSFANKLVFDFKDGITAIVGPNGSGKSNVADAVRWVLGEQSAKQLRGSRMEDVIFAGTETRKPLGFAYVAITFDNSDHFLAIDYAEVTVARRVYRSGESEYLINGSACLLKDVKEMFFDTGIGKEGYSIIGQGQIDKILSGKPEDRRELFDEAAGIVKYKKRKALALKNLEEERQNLARVNDVLSELELRIGPLRGQSAKAKKFLALRDELRLKDICVFIADYDGLNAELAELKEKAGIAAEDLKQASDRYLESRAKLDELEEAIAETSKGIDSGNDAISGNKVKAEKLEGEINLRKQQAESEKENEKRYAERLSALEGQLKKDEEEEASLLLEKSENEKAFNEYDAKKSDAEELINGIIAAINDQEAELDSCNKYIISLMDKSSEIKSEQKKYETMLEHNMAQKAEMDENLSKLAEELSKAEAQAEDIKKQIKEREEYAYGKKQEAGKLRLSLREAERKARAEEENFQTCQRKCQETLSKRNALISLAERYEGYGESVKAVMGKKAEYPGIIGTVSDIISVDKKYETAVEVGLGGNIRDIVTDTAETAKELIRYLKDNRLGRATFLPLSDITAGASYDGRLDNEKGVLGPLSTFVKADKKYEETVRYLLGRLILADNADNALALSRKYGHTLRIVTLSGEFFNAGGSISGGSYRNKGSLLGRRREIDELKTALADLKKELEKSRAAIDGCEKEREDLAARIKGIDDDVGAKMLELNTLRVRLKQAGESIESRKKDYEAAKSGGGKLAEDQKDIEASLETLSDRLGQNEIENEKCGERIAELNKALEENKKKRSETHDIINKADLDRTAFMQKISFGDEKLEKVRDAIRVVKGDIADTRSGMELARKTAAQKEKEIGGLRKSIDELGGAIKELEEDAKRAKEEYNGLMARQKAAVGEREEYANTRNELEKEQIRLSNRQEKISAQLDSLTKYMWDEYELTYRQALKLKPEGDAPYNRLKADARRLRQEIKDLGEVNVNSIGEYAEVSERYENMKIQHDDITESEKRLLSFIEDLDGKMRTVFIEKFGKISEQYNIVFRELFGGGKGMLTLTAGEDVLDAGISIVAQPPGKTLKSVSMLSGGEKALSAIAILFAIQNLKPSPFCVLDEIEAALDDSNIKRFAGYLDKLKSKSQYIVITHRQGTMAAADTLYGITMQEKGVSTMVSVDLVEQQLEKEVKGNE